MRAIFMMVASIFLAAGLFGCNQKTEATQTVAAAVTPPPPAVLPPPPPPPAPPEPSYRLRHAHHIQYARHYPAAPYMGHGHVSYASYQDEGYDGSYGPYDDGYGPDVAAEERHGDDGYGPPPEPVWTDGHGRAHYETPFDGDQPAESPDDSHARRAPYHGWNSDCDRRRS